MTIIEKGSRAIVAKRKKVVTKKVSGKGHKKNKGHLFFLFLFAFLCAVQKNFSTDLTVLMMLIIIIKHN